MEKEIADPIHGHIILHPLCVKIIDTPEFQRLRNISQCGIASFVYPSATHNRFVHSIGVYHLAGKVLDVLQNDTTLRKIKDETNEELLLPTDILCLKIAGLCHDLGHGPFSHTWENFVREKNPESMWKHEDFSIEIFRRIAKHLKDYFNYYGIYTKECEFIEKLILGNSNNIPDKRKLFLFEIVANTHYSVDVDKWDYMLRDSHHFGISPMLDYSRILTGIKITENKDGEFHIGFRRKLGINILEMFEFRARMHRTCYQHPKCKVVEMMLIDALCAADDNYKFFGLDKKLSECHTNINEFLKISDFIFECMKYNLVGEGSFSIINRLIYRHLYTIIGLEEIKKDSLKNANLKKIKEILEKTFPGHRFKTDFLIINIGSEKDFMAIIDFFALKRNEKAPNLFEQSSARYNSNQIICVCTSENISGDDLKKMMEQFSVILKELKMIAF